MKWSISILIAVSILGLSLNSPTAVFNEANQIAAKIFLGRTADAFEAAGHLNEGEAYKSWFNIALACHMTDRIKEKEAALAALKSNIKENPKYQYNPRPLGIALTFDAATGTTDFSSALWPECISAVQGSYYWADNQIVDALDVAFMAFDRKDAAAISILETFISKLLEKTESTFYRTLIIDRMAELYTIAGNPEKAAFWLPGSNSEGFAFSRGTFLMNRYKENVQQILHPERKETNIAITNMIIAGNTEKAKKILQEAVDKMIASELGDYANSRDWGLQFIVMDLLENTPTPLMDTSIALSEVALEKMEDSSVKEETQTYVEIKQADPELGTKFQVLVKLLDSNLGPYR